MKHLMHKTVAAIGLLGGTVLAASPAFAQCVPSPVAGLVCPDMTPGKEYSTVPDMNDVGAFSPGQTLLWIGGDNGPSFVADGLNYRTPNDQVDAMANTADHLYYHILPGKSVDRDADGVHLLFNTGNERHIRYETPFIPFSASWGAPVTFPSPTGSQTGVDALEVWGGEGLVGADANRFSLTGDPYGISVYKFDPTTSIVTPWLSKAAIGAAVGLDDSYWSNLDLDALMVGDFDNFVLFSLAPIAGFDGGEVWTWDLSKPAATFLKHGGHTWDTAFDIMATYGTPSENLTVLEAVDVSAVPEPESYALALSGLLVAGAMARRRR